jgi:XTP/dITP diphosphohydrolase
MMKKRLLFGTANQAKVDHIRAFLESLPVEISSPRDLDIDIVVREDGKSPEENAEKKAKAYFAESDMPTFAIDAGLYVAKFPDEKQPGVFVRRIYGTDRDATDAEILDYYVRELAQVGGESVGIWRVSVVLVTSTGRVFAQSYSLETMLTSKASDILIPGAPISSLMIDPATGKYYSEMAYNERPDSRWIRDIIQQYLDLEEL